MTKYNEKEPFAREITSDGNPVYRHDEGFLYASVLITPVRCYHLVFSYLLPHLQTCCIPDVYEPFHRFQGIHRK